MPAAPANRESVWRLVALALVVPAVLFVPTILAGRVFLPFLPVALPPLAAEYPTPAREAARDAHWVTGDRIFPFLTDQVALREEVITGSLPTWEPNLGLGLPLYAGTLVGAAYPPNWLAFLLPPERAAAAQALVSLVIAGLGLALFLRRLGLHPGACAVGVAALQLGGWGLANLFYFMKVDAAAWLPWSLWAVEGLVRGKRWSGTALACATALSLLAGFVPIALFAMGCAALYGLVRLGLGLREAPERPHAGRSTLALVVFLGLGGAAALVQLLPTYETSRLSPRQDSGAQDLVRQTLPWASALGVVVPDLFGSPTESTAPGELPVAWWLCTADEWFKAEASSQLEWNAYAGAAVFLLALAGVVARPRRAAFPALALLFTFAFAQGWPGIRLLYHLPGVNLGAPGRILSVAWVLWPWLAALGAQALFERAPRAVPTFLVSGALLAAGTFVLWVGLDPEGWARGLETTLLERYGERFDQTLEDVRRRVPPERAIEAGRRLRDSFAHALSGALAALAVGVAALVLGRPRGRWAPAPSLRLGAVILGVVLLVGVAPVASEKQAAATAALVVLGMGGLWAALHRREERAGLSNALWAAMLLMLVCEGLYAWRPNAGGRPLVPDELFPTSHAIEAVREAAGDGRVMRFDPSESGIADVVQLARPNMLAAYGIGELTPFVVFLPSQLRELFERAEPRSLFRLHVSRIPEVALLDHPLLDLTRVSAVLSHGPLEHPRLEPVLEQPGFHVYHRSGTLEIGRIVPRAEAAASDDDVVELIAAGELEPERVTWIAPEHASEVGAETPLGDWRAGRITGVERPARNRLELEVQGSSGGWLVLHEQYAPGWKARVDGRRVPLVRADHAFRALPIPRGDCRVETWYEPASLEWGAALSALALVLAVVLGRRSFQRRTE